METISQLDAFRHALASRPKVVVHFWAPWCEPCKFLDTVLQQLAADRPGAVSVVRVEAEEAPEISEAFGVAVVPFFLFFHSGKQLDSLEGADAAALSAKFEALAAAAGTGSASTAACPAACPAAPGAAATPPVTTAAAPAPAAGGAEAVRQRCAALVSQRPVMLFMKGSADVPRCGFSGRVVDALRGAGCTDFGTFDIMGDEEVRQGLKEYSQWPTYPQLYVNGELVGGCDIVLEMAQTGELKEVLAEAGDAKGKLHKRLESLVNSHPVMLFMKGTPEAPRCGFSRKVVEALRDAGEEFGSFDILGDEDVRQGLKEYSQWPTYPQLYVRGELLGGCDIVLEMAQAGELKSTIDEMRARV